MKTYKVVSASTIEELEGKVNLLLNEGYQLCGGVAVVSLSSYTPRYYQAVAINKAPS